MSTKWAVVMAGLSLAATVSVFAGEKPSEAYVKSMKDLGAAVQVVSKAIPAEDFATVSKGAVSIIEALSVVEKYWAGKDDAMKIVQVAKKAAADLRVSAGLTNIEGVSYSIKELTETCTTCHAAHRERLADGSFEIK